MVSLWLFITEHEQTLQLLTHPNGMKEMLVFGLEVRKQPTIMLLHLAAAATLCQFICQSKTQKSITTGM